MRRLIRIISVIGERCITRLCFFFLFVLSGLGCNQGALDNEIADLKARLQAQEVLLQTLFRDGIKVSSFSEQEGIYVFTFSDGLTVKMDVDLFPLVSIGNNGHWYINGIDSGYNAYDALPTADIRIIDGYWYINSENTGIRAVGYDGYDGKDGNDAPVIISIIEYEDFWKFYFSDGSSLKVEKEPNSYNIVNSVVSKYLTTFEYDSSDYYYSMVSDFILADTDYRKDWPLPIIITWANDNSPNNKEIITKHIVVTDNNGFRVESNLELDDESFSIYNLAPNTPYCVKISETYSDGTRRVIKSQTIVPTGQLRMLRIDGEHTSNFRDLGGWKTSDGGFIKYGRLIRGAEVYRDTRYIITISESGIQQLLDLGVDVELDFGDQYEYSPLPDYGIEFVNSHSYFIVAYAPGLEDERYRLRFGNCIKLMIERLREDKTVLFHCSAGADRTGTLAFLIEGLLGVSESDMSKDYELTSFSQYGTKRRDNSEFVPFVQYINQHFEGKTINQKIFNLATTPVSEGGLGIGKDEIECFRKLMVQH